MNFSHCDLGFFSFQSQMLIWLSHVFIFESISSSFCRQFSLNETFHCDEKNFFTFSNLSLSRFDLTHSSGVNLFSFCNVQPAQNQHDGWTLPILIPTKLFVHKQNVLFTFPTKVPKMFALSKNEWLSENLKQ